MAIFTQKALRLPETYLLVVGVGLGYAALIVTLGSGWLVWVAGAVISLGAVGLWWWELSRVEVSNNLLDPNVFAEKLPRLGRLDPSWRSIWESVIRWATESQAMASRISEQDPNVTGDLLETLYSVMALTDQIAKALTALDQIKTPTYRQLTQQRIQSSADRIQATDEQLRSWHDQLILTGLDQASAAVTFDLPLQLRRLNTSIKVELQSWLDSPPGG